jgi:hypothetical protein
MVHLHTCNRNKIRLFMSSDSFSERKASLSNGEGCLALIYLSKSAACSHPGGHHYLNNLPSHNLSPLNGPILTITKILCHIMSSAAKAKVHPFFLNTKEGMLFPLGTGYLAVVEGPSPGGNDGVVVRLSVCVTPGGAM